jgi:hypothetical protein
MAKVFTNLLVLFMGFAIGRIGHILGGQIIWVPHHWIIALLIIILPFFWRSKKYPRLMTLIVYFGVGLFISDLRDFLLLKTFGLDDVSVLKFWNIN